MHATPLFHSPVSLFSQLPELEVPFPFLSPLIQFEVPNYFTALTETIWGLFFLTSIHLKHTLVRVYKHAPLLRNSIILRWTKV